MRTVNVKSFLVLLLTFVISAGTVHAGLKTRWVPPKPEHTVIDTSVFAYCITVKFVEGSQVRLRNKNLISLTDTDLTAFHDLMKQFEINSISRLFSRHEYLLEEERERGQQRSGKELADLNNYYRVILDSSENPGRFIDSLNELYIIEIAFPVPKPYPAEDIDPETPDFSEGQGYLYEAPEGVDAPAAWQIEGGTGTGVKIIDIEGGWNFDHEDFPEPFFVELEDPGWAYHGDAVIGIMIAGHNGYGIDGICPDAEIGGYSMMEVYPDNGWPNVADIINNTAAELDEGDLFLIELHNAFQGYMSPMETWQDNFDAIEAASANGIIPMEAGGNGDSDLDGGVYEGRFDPENRHSGAVLVGAGNPPSGNYGPDRSRCSFSNYGQRVDLQGWGYEVTTTGYGDLFYPNGDVRQWYTAEFSGTSSATPIVSGAVACVQGIYKTGTDGRYVLTGEQIRDILVESGTPQNEEGRQGHIGPRPNLADAIELIPYRMAFLYGFVSDFADDAPIEGAVVRSGTVMTVTDVDGRWELDVTMGEHVLEISAFGYNDSTLAPVELEEDDTLEVNIALLHPEFIISDTVFSATLAPESATTFDLFIENTGNGPLQWAVSKHLPRGADLDPWQYRLSYMAGDTIGDSRIEGLLFIDDLFYLAGGNIQGREDGPNMIYVLDQDGSLVDSYQQETQSRYGLRDLAWDGELIWGGEENIIYGLTLDGRIERSFEGNINSVRCMAWDIEEGVLWTAGITTDITGYDRDGNEIGTLSRQGLRLYGLAYWDDDPDGYQLYIYQNPGEGRHVIHKMNTTTSDTMFVAELEVEAGIKPEGSPCAAFITDRYDVYSIVFMALVNDGEHDRIDIWQLESRKDWFGISGIDSIPGSIDAGETLELELFLDAAELDTVTYEGELVFEHNARGESASVSVVLDVRVNSISDEASKLPTDFGFTSVYPNPFNSATTISYSLPEQARVRLKLYDINGRQVASLVDKSQKAGNYSIAWNAIEFPSGVYFCQLDVNNEQRIIKLALVR